MLVLVCHIFEQNLPCLQPLLYNNLQKKPKKKQGTKYNEANHLMQNAKSSSKMYPMLKLCETV